MLSLVAILVLGVLACQAFAGRPEAIVGGTLAVLGEFPYQCSLNIYDSHHCGCSIINEVQVLTAAHCLYETVRPPYNSLRIFVGTVNSRRGTIHLVKTIRVHPHFKNEMKTSWPNDIAVITLQVPILFGRYVSPIALATEPPVAGSQCVVSGWGRTIAKGPLSEHLLKINTALIEKNTCRNVFGSSITETHVCAFSRYGIGTCNGDSGGPLVCNGQQVGITSFVIPCAMGKPDVYTNVYHHLEFIQQAKVDAYGYY